MITHWLLALSMFSGIFFLVAAILWMAFCPWHPFWRVLLALSFGFNIFMFKRYAVDVMFPTLPPEFRQDRIELHVDPPATPAPRQADWINV